MPGQELGIGTPHARYTSFETNIVYWKKCADFKANSEELNPPVLKR